MAERKHEIKDRWQELVPRPGRSFPRHFLSSNINLSDWGKCKPYADDLLQRPLNNSKSLKAWLSDYMEFQNALMEEAGRLYIDMTSNTSDTIKEKAYLQFVEKVEPELERFEHR